METIICHFNLFTHQQTIHLMRSDGSSEVLGRCSLDDLGKMIVLNCMQYKVLNIHLYGNEQFADSLIQEIDQRTAYSYSKNLIKIEVN